MQDHQNPDTPHPMWCVKDTDTGVHCGEMHRHGQIFTWLLQDPGGSYDGPQIYLDGRMIRCTAAKGWASTFAVLGHPELAATITRLGELAEADAAFTRPQPAVDAAAEITRLTEGWDEPATSGEVPCGEGDAKRYTCTLPIGHEGDHVAHGAKGNDQGDLDYYVITTWPQVVPDVAQPSDLPNPLACGRCGTTGHDMDPVTDSHAPGGVKNECHDLTDCGERAAVKA